MRFSDLELFLVVVEEGSITAAARRLRMAQPSVSERMAAMEKELATALLVREPRSVCPTPAGRILYDSGRQILSQFHQARQHIQEQTEVAAGPLVVAAGETSCNYVMPPLLGDFKRLYPLVEPRLQSGVTSANFLDLLERRRGLAVVPDPGAEERVEKLFLCSYELCLIAPANHPLAGAGAIDPEVLADEPFVVRRPPDRGSKHVEKHVEQLGLKPGALRVQVEVGSYEAVKTAVAHGCGIAFVPRLAVTGTGDTRWCIVEVRGTVPQWAFYLVRPIIGPHAFAERKFWEFCQTCARLQVPAEYPSAAAADRAPGSA